MNFSFKKTITVIFVFVLFAGGVGFVFSQEASDDLEEFGITFEDLGLREPRILPGDSLYFLKEWRRGFRRVFSFGDLRQSIFRSDLMNELAAEVKALGERGASEENLSRALQNYEENAMRLEERISSLESTSENEKVSDLLNMLMERLVVHEEVFAQIGEVLGVEEKLNSAREGLETATAKAISELDSPEGFKSRFENLASSFRENDLKELRFVYILNYIEEKVPEEVRSKIRELETDLTSRFEGRFKAEPENVIPRLNSLPVEGARDLSIFDEIRERVTDSGLKSSLNAVRQESVRNSNGKVAEGDIIVEIIQSAEEASAELKERISSDDYVSTRAVEELLERAQFHLTQATDLLEEGNEVTALGQATAAQATAENGLSQIRLKSEIDKENLSLRVKFDELVDRAKAKNLTRDSSPDLYDRFDEVEKVIVGADTAGQLREAKVALAEIEVIIVNKK